MSFVTRVNGGNGKHSTGLVITNILCSPDTSGLDIMKTCIQIKLLIENKLIICALGNLYYKISREKFEPELGFESRTSGFLARRSTT